MIPKKFKGATSTLSYTDEMRRIIEHENGGYSALVSKVNVGNGVCNLDLFYKITLYKLVKAPLYLSLEAK